MEINKSKNTSWGGVADWYKEVVSDAKSYQKQLILPNMLRLMDPKQNDQILDLACGEGWFSEVLAKAGALVTGVDISKELISIALDKNIKGANFKIASADNLNFIKDKSFDKAVCILSLQNIENIKDVISEAYRVLKTGGHFYIVLNHPCFRIPKESGWGFDDEQKIQYRRIDRYLSELKIPIQMHPGDRPKDYTVSFHRPLQSYFKFLNKAGFLSGRFEEWNSTRKSEPGPRASIEDRARKEIPIFALIEAVKLD